MLDIHKVKPVHGWREFFGEVGIIVLGVLIALCAEALVERLHWHEQIAAGRAAMTEDAKSFVVLATERETVSACLARRFADLADIIDAASRTGRLPPVGPIGNPPAREWRFGSWDSLVAAQVTTHMRHDELEKLAGIVENGTYADQLNRDEFNDWSILFTIVGPGRRFNPGGGAAAPGAQPRGLRCQAGADYRLPEQRRDPDLGAADGCRVPGRARHPAAGRIDDPLSSDRARARPLRAVALQI